MSSPTTRYKRVIKAGLAGCVIAAVAVGLILLEKLPDDSFSNIKDYEYVNTKRIIAFVTKAAAELENDGERIFPEFRKKDGPWVQGNLYLFVYDLNGICKVHPYQPDLEGKCLIDFRDYLGKPVIRRFLESTSNSLSRASWVHYYWIAPGDIYPMWKSSYITRVKTPSGNEYLIGSGLNNLNMERRFITDMVDSAVREIQKSGKSVFDNLRDKTSQFNALHSYIFVIDSRGNAVVDPGFPTQEGRNWLDLEDADGKKFIAEIINRAQTADSIWYSFKWPKPGSDKTAKKIMYVRKVRVGNEDFLVGADYYASQPIWMK